MMMIAFLHSDYGARARVRRPISTNSSQERKEKYKASEFLP